MDVREIHIELLLSKRVLDLSGKSVGRIEEIFAEQQGVESVVKEYLIGPAAMVERFSAWTLGLPMSDFLRWGKIGNRYRLPWDKLDLSDPNLPRSKSLFQARAHAPSPDAGTGGTSLVGCSLAKADPSVPVAHVSDSLWNRS